MLITEWSTEEAREVWREEGWEEGWEKGREETARNALAEGASVEFVNKITGLDIETIKSLQSAATVTGTGIAGNREQR